ncbi:TonB-dependent receptor [Hephaestia sp. GCM10023244]|uniref:TonB-dependent receptor n=1 Tax=unclassified Hephaestia TaxID=2631281 RepID=UPI002076F507|nr:TonB-dependent receptor [Hephaestia sp. MAHUQ-44]MCM8730510.1 TonB-dependent receptor [Hephaestia sp. MAHUQ-44]
MTHRSIAKFAASMLSIAFMQATAHATDAAGARDGAEAAVTTVGADASAQATQNNDGYTGLTDIVVTATRRETNLQKTPIAIAVLDADVIEKRHVQSLLDLADGGVPSLRVATFEARQSALTVGIRGIVPFDQNQVAREPGVGVYVDGVYLGRSQGLNAALFDVQRIEVLRGPQGTLFGRNTEGGALSIVTKAPTGEFGGRVSAGIGNYGAYNGEVHLDLPAFANFAIKVDGVVQHQDATIKNPASGQYGWNYYNRAGGKIAGRWTPIEGLTIDLSYDRARNESTPFYSQLINYNPNNLPVGSYAGTTLVCPAGAAKCIAPLSPLVQVSGDRRMDVADMGVIQQLSTDDTHGYTAAIKYKLNADIELRSISAWRGVETHQWDGSAGAHRSAFVPNGEFGRYSLSELFQNQFSQELQIVGSIPQLDFVLGGYYFNEHAREAAATPNPLKWNADGTGYTFINQAPANPNAPISSGNQGWDRRYWFVQRDSHAVGKSYALFGQGTYTPAGIETVHLTAGGRYTHETREGALAVVNNAPFAGAILDYANSRFDPMVTLAWEAAPGVNLYAKYSTGFRAGGANSRSSSFRQFDPESVKSYEIGAKTDFLDHRVRLNVAAYIMDRTNTQIDFDYVDTRATIGGSPNPYFNKHTEETVNVAGTSKIKGVEVELTVRPVTGLTLGASYAYTDVNIPPVPNPIKESLETYGVITQVYTVFTPKSALSGSLDYETPVGSGDSSLRLHLDANYAGPQYSFQAESAQTQSSFIVNGSLALASIPMNSNGVTGTISIWARNLLNETHIYRRSDANNAILGSYANFNPPRTFGLQGSINF